MKKLFEYLGNDHKKGTFGIEIECEGENLKIVHEGTWRTEADGSLRGRFPDKSCEWVLEEPLSLKDAITAVNQLSKKQSGADTKINFSYRTSTHVHVNAQDMTEDQYLNFIYTWLLLEEPLIRFCGPQRRANRFCLSINDGEGAMDYLNLLFTTGFAALPRLYENDIRYAALNIAASRKYGSIELRCMRGTLDVEVLTIWLTALQAIRDFSMQCKNVREIHDKFVKSPPLEFMRNILKDCSKHFEYKNVEDSLRNNFSITLELVYDYRQKEEKEDIDLDMIFKAKARGRVPVWNAEYAERFRMPILNLNED